MKRPYLRRAGAILSLICCMDAETETYEMPIGGVTVRFLGYVNGDVVVSTLPLEKLSKNTSPNLCQVSVLNGQVNWRLQAKVTLEQATQIAVDEAQRIVGLEFKDTWVLQEAGRKVSGGNEFFVHHFYFCFAPIGERPRPGENLPVVVMLDGTPIPIRKPPTQGESGPGE